MMEQFQKDNIITKVMGSQAAHSPRMYALYDELLADSKTVITEPKPRSIKWVSTVNPTYSKCSAEYFTDGTCNPVYFYEAVKKIPENAIIVEVGPWAQMDSLLKPDLPKNCEYIGLIKRSKPEILAFLEVSQFDDGQGEIGEFLKLKKF